MGKWCVVVPTCRPQEFARFEKAWESIFAEHEVTVYPVRDEPASWEKWPDWVPRQSDMCRSWGFYEAWRDGHEFTLSLDDDVRPRVGRDPFGWYEYAFNRTYPCVPYLSVSALTDAFDVKEVEMRGFPYDGRGARAMVQYGGWNGMLDYDGRTQLAGVPDDALFYDGIVPVPRGSATTCCAMNMAFRTEFTPCMWQLPVLPGTDRYKRWGDIWSGLIQKRVLDARGEVMLVNGRASVLHERMSDPVKNAELEAPGMPLNEGLWEWLCSDKRETFEHVAESLAWSVSSDASGVADTDPFYIHFRECLYEWLALFK